MVQIFRTAAFLSATALALVGGHPGEDHHEDSHTIVARRLFAQANQAAYKTCQDSEHVRKLQERLATRRLTFVNQLRDEQRRRRLDAATVLAKDHKGDQTISDVTKVTSAELFGNSPTCILQPVVTHGPYYVKGELVRKDMRETQPGVDLYTELLVLDTSTCKPVPNYYIDFWHCNATGVYSGVVASTNGNSNDASNINTTFTRGLYATDSDGVVQFVTKFPGHYAGRTTHVHVLGNHGGTLLPNNTYSGGTVSSIGQLFFDQALITAVEATTTYKVNTQAVTKNSDDNIFTESTANSFDPVVQYVYLGDTVDQGIFSWATIGVNLNATQSVQAAATWTANGGVASTSTSTGTGNTGNSSDTTSKSTGSTLPKASTIAQFAVAGLALLAPLFL